jgi:hypothetical protein
LSRATSRYPLVATSKAKANKLKPSTFVATYG